MINNVTLYYRKNEKAISLQIYSAVTVVKNTVVLTLTFGLEAYLYLSALSMIILTSVSSL